MDFYSQIPALATSFGCTPDKVIWYTALAIVAFTVCTSFALSLLMDVGILCAKGIVKVFPLCWRKAKKNNAPGKERCSQ